MHLSVIVPIYNKAEYIEPCLESILEQDLESFEVIAVDDGSTDDSGKVCDEMARLYPNLKVMHVPNGGVTAARRIGVEHAKGEYVTFVDADDLMKPQALSVLLDAIRETGADEVVATYDTHYGEHITTKMVGTIDSEWMIRQLMASTAKFCVLWAVIFRRDKIIDCLYAPRVIRSGEDILMQILFLLKRPKVVFIPDSVYVYTVGLPNDRQMSLQEQVAYDDILRKAMSSRWDEFSECFTLRRIKMYENFIYNRMFHILFPYYSDLRKSLTKGIPLADRIAELLPPRIAYFPISFRKKRFI